MKAKNNKLILIFSLVIFSNSLFGNYAFKKKVKSVCSSYRIIVQSSQFLLESDQFTINLESGRNNFEMFMLVGFGLLIRFLLVQITQKFFIEMSVKLSDSTESEHGQWTFSMLKMS